METAKTHIPENFLKKSRKMLSEILYENGTEIKKKTKKL